MAVGKKYKIVSFNVDKLNSTDQFRLMELGLLVNSVIEVISTNFYCCRVKIGDSDYVFSSNIMKCIEVKDI